MMRHVVSGLAAAALASAAIAQQPDPFGRQFIPSERNHGAAWAPDDRLALLGQKLFFDARLCGTGTTACASCHDIRASPSRNPGRSASLTTDDRGGAMLPRCWMTASSPRSVGWPISLTRTASSKSV